MSSKEAVRVDDHKGAHAAVHLDLAEQRLRQLVQYSRDAELHALRGLPRWPRHLHDSIAGHLSKADRIAAGESVDTPLWRTPIRDAMSAEVRMELDAEEARTILRFESRQLELFQEPGVSTIDTRCTSRMHAHRHTICAQTPPLCDGFDSHTVARLLAFWKHRSAAQDAHEHCPVCWTRMLTTPERMFDDGDPILSLVAWPADDWSAEATCDPSARLMPWHVIPLDKYEAHRIRAVPIACRPATLLHADAALLASLQREFRSQLRQDPTSAWYVA